MLKEMSLTNLATAFAEAAVAEAIVLHHALEKCAKLIEVTAKSEFGTYQPEVGPFPDWPELAESTQEARSRAGFTPNDPLLVTGKLRDSIHHETNGLEAVIGSTSDIMPYHEFGTASIPPRPVLGPAAFRNKKHIQRILGKAVVDGLFRLNGKMLPIHPALGYDMEIK